MPTAQQDIALFKSLQQGDQSSLGALFNCYYASLCQFAHQYVRNKQEAEEAVSEVFFQLWKNRNHLIIEQNVKAYLYVSVKNSCLAVIRLRQPLFEDIDDVLTATSLVDHSHPEKIIEFEQLHDHFQRAVDLLPPRCRQIFILNRFDSLKYKEISDLLSISEKTVEHQIAKALSILRESLHRYLRV